jgi:hypothetical protein
VVSQEKVGFDMFCKSYNKYSGPQHDFGCESLLDMLDSIINPMEEPMFNPILVQDRVFTVQFTKQDGTAGMVTGKLVAPNYEGTSDDLLAYCVGLLEQDRVPVYTAQGWRSFYTSKVTQFQLEV